MPRPSVVLDSNVIVSAHLNPEGNEAFVLSLGFTGNIHLCISAPILAEYELVLHRDKFRLDPGLVKESLQLIRATATIVTPSRALAVAPDPADNRFLECAEATRADFLVTGNKRHFPQRWKITSVVNARELIELIAPIVKLPL